MKSQKELEIRQIIKEKQKSNKIEHLKSNDFTKINNNLYYNNKESKKSKANDKDEDKSSYHRNKLYFIYSSNNIFNPSFNDREKVNEIIIESNNYLLPSFSFDSIRFQNNNINENRETTECTITSTISKGSNDTDEKKTLQDYIYYLQLSLYKSYERNIIIATDLSYMFYECSSLESITGISKWNTNFFLYGTYVRWMFYVKKYK